MSRGVMTTRGPCRKEIQETIGATTMEEVVEEVQEKIMAEITTMSTAEMNPSASQNQTTPHHAAIPKNMRHIMDKINLQPVLYKELWEVYTGAI